jgi:hypothetical protein
MLVKLKMPGMNLKYLACFIGLLICCSCEKETDKNTSFVIPLNDCKEGKFSGKTVRLCLTKIEDSRCCSLCYCVWAGVAKASFTLSLKGQDIPFELATMNMLPTYKNDTLVQGYKIKLVNVYPYPGEPDDNPRVEVEVIKQ